MKKPPAGISRSCRSPGSRRFFRHSSPGPYKDDSRPPRCVRPASMSARDFKGVTWFPQSEPHIGKTPSNRGAGIKKAAVSRRCVSEWCPRRDSNPDLTLRRGSFYPVELRGHRVRQEMRTDLGFYLKSQLLGRLLRKNAAGCVNILKPQTFPSDSVKHEESSPLNQRLAHQRPH